MGEIKPLASLNAGLLARKGGARAAMRQPVLTVHSYRDALNRVYDSVCDPDAAAEPASGALLQPVDMPLRTILPVGDDDCLSESTPAGARARRSAASQGRRAAFTLRLDTSRHVRLRLASTLARRSAQALLTEALDRLFSHYPQIEGLAGQGDFTDHNEDTLR